MKKTGRYNKMIWGAVTTVIILVLAYTVGIPQVQKLSGTVKEQPGNIADTTITGEDSVEVVGVPVDDDPWAELEKIVNAYYSKTGITYKGTIKVIDDNGEQEKVLEENPFEYSILGKNFHYKLGAIECVNNDNSLLVIDHQGKTIAYSPALAYTKNKTNKLFDIKAFKELMLQNKANARVTQTAEEKILTIDKITDPSIQGYRIYYSPETYRVTRMLIGMLRLSPLNEDEEENVDETGNEDIYEEGLTEYIYYVEVSFSNIEILSLKPKEFNPGNKFIRIRDDKIEPTPEYSEYVIINAGD